jgi:acetyltransferase-like isoleucine patch superfamily enzyme
MTAALAPSSRAPGLLLAPGVVVPDDAELGPYVTLHHGVVLGSGVRIEQGAVIGRVQRLDTRSRTPRHPLAGVTMLESSCSIGGNAIVVAGARIGAGAWVGDHALLREGTALGAQAMIGTCVILHPDAEVGPRARIQAYTAVGPGARIEEDVMVGVRVNFIGDPTMGRRSGTVAPEDAIVLRRACRVGSGVTLFPGIQVGEEGVVGAGSIVRADVPARTVVVGAPARIVRPVREDELIDRWVTSSE